MEHINLSMRSSCKEIVAGGVPGGDRLVKVLYLQPKEIACLVPPCTRHLFWILLPSRHLSDH